MGKAKAERQTGRQDYRINKKAGEGEGKGDDGPQTTDEGKRQRQKGRQDYRINKKAGEGEGKGDDGKTGVFLKN